MPFFSRTLVLTGLAAFTATPIAAADRSHPVVIELFQSQGCSSCPPADANLNHLAATRPDVLALSFAVAYWDQLGWKDTFAQPAFTQRQWDYARAGGRRNVSTPQLIVNGRTAIVGSNLAQVEQVIREADRGQRGPAIDVRGGQIVVSAMPNAKPAAVWLVRYDPRVHNVPIRAGENGGQTIAHRNIVRSMVRLGEWRGKQATFAYPKADPILRAAVLVQGVTGGPILAARPI